MRFSWTQWRGALAATAALVALQGAPVATAQQFVPYGGGQQQPAAQPQQQYAAQQKAPMYTAMAVQGNAAHSAAESIAVGPVQSAAAPGCNCQGAPVSAPAPVVNYPQPSAAYESYPSSSGNSSCASNAYNTYSGGAYGLSAPYGGTGFAGGGYGGGVGGGVLGGHGLRHSGRHWFGGFYGLYMQRSGNSWTPLAFASDPVPAPGYYPTDTEYVANLQDLDQDNFGGAEVRFGSTLGGGCNGPQYGWDFGYWGLFEESTQVAVTDVTGDTNRLYGMIDYRGLEANMGAGYRPMNHYFDFGAPTTDNTAGGDIEIRTLTARNTFSVQSIELNLLHFSLFGSSGFSAGLGGYGSGVGAGLGSRGIGSRLGLGHGGCASGGCTSGGCDSCAGGGCAGGCGVGGGCGCGGASRFSTTCLVGVRYFRADDDFMFRSDFENVGAGTTGFISNNIDVDNHLVGAQFGSNTTYRCGNSGRWALHCNSVVGVYNNRSEVWNRFDSPLDDSRFVNNGNADFNLRYEDDNVAVIGELRAGASYQYSCNWRLFGGYRLLGISGIAQAFDQIPTDYVSPNQVSYVDSSGSIFLHGLQGGVEFVY